MSLHLSGSKEARSLKPNLQRTAQVAVDQDALFVFQSLRLADFGSSEPVDLLSSLSSQLQDLASRLGCVAFSPPSKRIEGLGYRRLLLLSSTAAFFFLFLSSQVHPPRFQVPAQSLLHCQVSCHPPCSGCSLGPAASQSCWGLHNGMAHSRRAGRVCNPLQFPHRHPRTEKREAVGRYY